MQIITLGCKSDGASRSHILERGIRECPSTIVLVIDDPLAIACIAARAASIKAETQATAFEVFRVQLHILRTGNTCQ
jgi:hypothetical protein